MVDWLGRHAGDVFLVVVVGVLFVIFLWHGLRERKKPWFREYVRRRRHMTVGEKVGEFSLEMAGGILIEAILWALGAGLIALLTRLLGLWG